MGKETSGIFTSTWKRGKYLTRLCRVSCFPSGFCCQHPLSFPSLRSILISPTILFICHRHPTIHLLSPSETLRGEMMIGLRNSFVSPHSETQSEVETGLHTFLCEYICVCICPRQRDNQGNRLCIRLRLYFFLFAPYTLESHRVPFSTFIFSLPNRGNFEDRSSR